ncbi:SDR family oxidoreductase [Nonomuraea sp. NPDC003804]|uniref:SDR family oxidoreductase n=1 Tax=Nonomuraea sp. NPDC003804 TaxID=3154547 RepID=UPI0033B1F327
MRISLVTGANKGIGFEIARQLGGTVLLGARDEERGRKAELELRAEHVDARFVHVDVTDTDTIEKAATWIGEEFGQLDALINNAGSSLLDWNVSPSEVPLDAVRRTYEVNVIGPIALINAMLPLLRKAPAARIVNVSSRLGSLTSTTDWDSGVGRVNLLAYNSSKSALNSITVSYAKELRDTPIKVNAVNPGFCDTDMAADMARGNRGLRSAAEGARAAVMAALLPEDGPTGTFFGEDGPLPW